MSTAIMVTRSLGRFSTSSPRSSALRAPRLRLTKRGRVVLTTLVALPLVVTAFLFALNGGVATATDQVSSTSFGATSFEQVTVAAGQTLWQLAGELAPKADPRDVVSDIVHLNQLTSLTVQPGQQLAIPSQYSH